MRDQLPDLMSSLRSWVDFDVAWSQRYAVATYCRMLYTLHTGRVCSKRAGLLWAMDALDPMWRPLFRQVLSDRARGLDFADRPRPGSVDAMHDFARYAETHAQRTAL